MRSRAEIEKEIKDLEMQIFHLEMKDGWDTCDYMENDHMNERLRQLKKELADGTRKEL